MVQNDDIIFNVDTPLGFRVSCTRTYWAFIVSKKHPAMSGHENDIKMTLIDPDEVRRSRRDESVFLFYKGQKPRWLCAVAREEKKSGSLITAYPTDAIKMGEIVWTKSK